MRLQLVSVAHRVTREISIARIHQDGCYFPIHLQDGILVLRRLASTFNSVSQIIDMTSVNVFLSVIFFSLTAHDIKLKLERIARFKFEKQKKLQLVKF